MRPSNLSKRIALRRRRAEPIFRQDEMYVILFNHKNVFGLQLLAIASLLGPGFTPHTTCSTMHPSRGRTCLLIQVQPMLSGLRESAGVV